MSVYKDATRKEIVRGNPPLECWGFTISPRYHVDRFHTYMNCPKNMDPDIAEHAKR